MGRGEIRAGRLAVEVIGISGVLRAYVGCFTHLNAIIGLYLTFTAARILLL